MTEYMFRFREEDRQIEAEFILHCANDDEARGVGRELQNHSPCPVIEVRRASTVVFHGDRRNCAQPKR